MRCYETIIKTIYIIYKVKRKYYTQIHTRATEKKEGKTEIIFVRVLCTIFGSRERAEEVLKNKNIYKNK